MSRGDVMQVCIKCKEEKLLSKFYKQPKAKSGRNSTCKECKKVYSLKRYYKSREEVSVTPDVDWEALRAYYNVEIK